MFWSLYRKVMHIVLTEKETGELALGSIPTSLIKRIEIKAIHGSWPNYFDDGLTIGKLEYQDSGVMRSRNGNLYDYDRPKCLLKLIGTDSSFKTSYTEDELVEVRCTDEMESDATDYFGLYFYPIEIIKSQ